MVEIRTESGDVTLLASIRREPDRLTLTFFDPAFQVPLLSVRIVRSVFVEERLSNFPLPSEAMKTLTHQVAEVYAAKYLEPKTSGMATRIGPWDVRLSEPQGKDGCRMPEWIWLRVGTRTAPAVDVRTIEVRCGYGD
ncbi:MAG: hypothetical protein WB493_12390 [Anaeromyxobacteraceae bacterium]